MASMLALAGTVMIAEQSNAVTTPVISANPTSGVVGASVTVTGSGFTANADGSIELGTTDVGAYYTTSTTGTFTVSFKVPSMATGTYSLEAWLTTKIASTPFTVMATGTTTTKATTTTTKATTTTTKATTTTTKATTTTAASTTTTTKPAPSFWQPATGTTFEWELGVNTAPEIKCLAQKVQICDFDFRLGEDETQAASSTDNQAAITQRRQLIQNLHANNIKVLCYIDGGSANFADRREFKGMTTRPAYMPGTSVTGYPGTYWLDYSTSANMTSIATLTKAQMQSCKNDGFDGVEPDELEAVDAPAAERGFAATDATQVTFNNTIAGWAHTIGLSVVHKGIPRLASQMHANFDLALIEDCNASADVVRNQECKAAGTIYFNDRKAFLVTNYNGGQSGTPTRDAAQCTAAATDHWSLVQKNLNLDARAAACWNAA